MVLANLSTTERTFYIRAGRITRQLELDERFECICNILTATYTSKEQEDLSWLRNLEASAKQSAEPSEPQRDLGGMPGTGSSEPAAQEEDLSWLNNLGGIDEPSQPFDQTQGKPAPAQPAAAQEGMS